VEAIRRAPYDGSVEDLFFYIEELLAGDAGIDVAGKMHTARSRNDIAITLYRMKVRRRILDISEAILEVQRVLLATAAAHTGTSCRRTRIRSRRSPLHWRITCWPRWNF
jgi:Argininosuccinate lyase